MSSRTDLCGGCRATGIPTAIPPGEPTGPITHPELEPIHLLPSSPPEGDSTNTRLASRAAQQIEIEAVDLLLRSPKCQ